MREDKNTLDIIDKVFNPGQLQVFSFAGNKNFLEKSFEAQLKHFGEMIQQASETYKKKSPQIKYGLFLSTEYAIDVLPDNFTIGDYRYPYFPKEFKTQFKNFMRDQSRSTPLIIAPGSFCWYKETKRTTYYYNSLYLFYQGEVQRYDKTYPAATDYLSVPNDLEEKFVFRQSKDNCPILEIGGLTLGVEICYDNSQRHLKTVYYGQQLRQKQIDIHIIVADALDLGDIKPIYAENLVFIKYDKDFNDGPESSNVFATLKKESTEKYTYINGKEELKISDEMCIYQFQNVNQTHSSHLLPYLEKLQDNGALTDYVKRIFIKNFKYSETLFKLFIFLHHKNLLNENNCNLVGKRADVSDIIYNNLCEISENKPEIFDDLNIFYFIFELCRPPGSAKDIINLSNVVRFAELDEDTQFFLIKKRALLAAIGLFLAFSDKKFSANYSRLNFILRYTHHADALQEIDRALTELENSATNKLLNSYSNPQKNYYSVKVPQKVTPVEPQCSANMNLHLISFCFQKDAEKIIEAAGINLNKNKNIALIKLGGQWVIGLNEDQLNLAINNKNLKKILPREVRKKKDICEEKNKNLKRKKEDQAKSDTFFKPQQRRGKKRKVTHERSIGNNHQQFSQY